MITINREEENFLNNHLLSIHDIDYIVEQFDIGQIKYFHKHFDNTVNMNFLIETNRGRYVIKMSNIAEDQLRSIIGVVNTLSHSGLPVLMPLQTKGSQYYIKFRNYRVQVTPFIEAHSFNRDPRRARSSGETLRKFHDVMVNYNEISTPRSSVYPSSEVLIKGLTRLEGIKHNFEKKDIALIKNLYTEITTSWENKSKGLVHTVIHGDWHERNLLYTAEGTVCCILDFDYVQRKERLFDIAYGMWNFLSRPQMSLFAQPFIQGYGTLDEQEIFALQLAIARISFFFICTASLNMNPIHELKRQLQRQVPFLQYILSRDGEKKILDICNIYKEPS